MINQTAKHEGPAERWLSESVPENAGGRALRLRVSDARVTPLPAE
jgi:hypothetical protein